MRRNASNAEYLSVKTMHNTKKEHETDIGFARW